jgi:hypothetical protein
MLRTVYKKAVPSTLRRAVWKTRRRLPRRLHDLQWEVGDRARLTSEADNALALGPWHWLFLLGCNNSGTTLLVETLQSHPLIRNFPREGQRLTSAIPNSGPLGIGRVFTQKLDLFRQIETDSGSCVPRLRYDWAYFSDPRPGIRLEKSPPNTLRSRWLQRYFTPSRFLVLVRNPYAVCEGIARRRGHSIEEAAIHWRTVHEVLSNDMPHLEQRLVVSYEDFCESPLQQLSRIQLFLGLEDPFDPSIASKEFNAHNMDNLDKSPRKLRNFNDRSISQLTNEQRATITRIVGETMIPWGYQPLGDRS